MRGSGTAYFSLSLYTIRRPCGKIFAACRAGTLRSGRFNLDSAPVLSAQAGGFNRGLRTGVPAKASGKPVLSDRRVPQERRRSLGPLQGPGKARAGLSWDARARRALLLFPDRRPPRACRNVRPCLNEALSRGKRSAALREEKLDIPPPMLQNIAHEHHHFRKILCIRVRLP